MKVRCQRRPWRSQGNTPSPRDDVDTGSWGERDVTAKMTPVSAARLYLKPKDLCGIPWRVVHWRSKRTAGICAATSSGASRTRCRRASQTGPTKAHEYVFLLSKSPRYYFDQDALREPEHVS